jgi:hypothetical protein
VTIATLAAEQGPIKSNLLTWFEQKKREVE